MQTRLDQWDNGEYESEELGSDYFYIKELVLEYRVGVAAIKWEYKHRTNGMNW